MLELKNISYTHIDGEVLFENLSFKIPKNSFTVILGNNGSGKSTLGKIISQLLIFDGQILFNNEKLNQFDVGLVFQNPESNFVRNTVIEDMAFGLENLNIPNNIIENKIKKMAKEINIEHLLDRKIKELSGGEKQKIAIAETLILNPKILVLDEAFSMIEEREKKELYKFLYEYHEKHPITIMEITHDMKYAVKSEQIILLNKGKLIFNGCTNDFFINMDLKQYNLEIPLNVEIYASINNKKISYFRDEYELKKLMKS